MYCQQNSNSMKRLTIIFLAMVPFMSMNAADIIWDGGGNGTDWSDVNNWDCNCMPASGDNVTIPSAYIATTVIVTGSVTVGNLYCYSGLQLNSGAQITVAGQFRMINGGDLQVQSGATIETTSLALVSVSDISGQIWNANLSNLGTINTTEIYLEESCDPSFPCFTALTNDGTINTTDLGISFGDYSQVINNGNMTLTGLVGIQTSLTSLNNQFTNNGSFSTNVPNYFGPTTNTSSGTFTIDNYINYFNTYNNTYNSPVKVLSTFTNQGAINMTNPQSNALYGIQVLPAGSFISTGTLNITSESYPIRNQGVCTVEGTSDFYTIGTATSLGIENTGTFNINNQATTFNCAKAFNNLSGGTLNIATCKPVALRYLYNVGTVVNNGIITFDPTSTTVTLSNSGSLANNGLMINNPYTVNLSSAQNQGAFVQRILGQKCVGTAIPSFISGEKVNVSNPTPGIFTDAALTISAGTYDLSTNIFTPSTAALGLTSLYIDLQYQSCPVEVVEIIFQYPISNPSTWYLDADYDGYGDPAVTTTSCAQPYGYVANNTDCDDNDYAVHPGATEICNDKDYNCDGMMTGPAPVLWYQDADYDNYGNPSVTLLSCTSPYGYVANSTDCDDTDGNVYPGAPETCSDKDYNCDGMITGTTSPTLWYQDADYDGYGNPSVTLLSCTPPSGYVSNNTDCNDNNFNVNPGAPEVCDNLDNNCNGMVDEGLMTGTAVFTFGAMNNSWSEPMNWSTMQVPAPCFDVIIPTPYNVVATGSGITAKSIMIQGGASLTFTGGTSTIQGGATFSINNKRTLNITNNSNIIIQNTGNGIDNHANIQCTGVNSITITQVTQNAIQNFPGAIFMDNGTTGLTLFNITGDGISNSGSLTKNGILSGSNINGDLIFNTGTFTNGGNIDFQNGTNFPQWVIHNQGTFNNNTGAYILFPTPSTGGNVSNMGILNTAGSTMNNNGIMNLFGNSISGSGTFYNNGVINGGL